MVTRTRVVRLGDVDSRGVLRLDATARYLQDVATDDVVDSPLGNTFAWVVRRTMIEVREPAAVDELVSVTTFCSGTGRCWAERRTSITSVRGAAIEAVSLWVRIDPESGRPTALNDDFDAVYGAAAGGRRVSPRLQLPARPLDQPGGLVARSWALRRVDIDPLNHVNNAAQWAALEEVMAERRARRRGVAEIEFLAPLDAPAEPGGTVDLVVAPAADAIEAWLVADTITHTALRWQPIS